MNDLEEICKNLDKAKTGCGNYCCIRNDYLCAKHVVNQYISKGSGCKDKNKLFALIIYCIILIRPLKKNKSVRKWEPYILTAIEEIEKEMNKN